ncbi:MAG: hypothetical protein NTZ33_06240 [Bacteroidetes bacterium]|nr:hypothetical protein [Bacteroidota bacterium]
MNLDAEQLKEIERMAELFFSAEEIAVNIEVDPDDLAFLILSKQGPAYAAYMTGWLKTDVELRKCILQSALNGSSPSQQMMKEYQNRSRNE